MRDLFSNNFWKHFPPSSESLPFKKIYKWCVWANAFLKWKRISPTNDVSRSLPPRFCLLRNQKWEPDLTYSQTRFRRTWDKWFAIKACPALHFTYRHHMGALLPPYKHVAPHAEQQPLTTHHKCSWKVPSVWSGVLPVATFDSGCRLLLFITVEEWYHLQ